MSDDDEKFGEFLHGAARDYNAPPGEVPRDEMWNAIRAGRRAAAPVAGGVATGEKSRTHLHIGRRQFWFGVAATMLIGVALGRFLLAPREAPRPLASVEPAPQPPAPELVIEKVTPLPSAAATVAAQPAVPHARGETAPARAAGYDLVTGEHLARVEALLTAYHATRSDVATDTSLARWAYDMISNTRLLLDSPAARDPARRRLLEDLELVLVQLVQHSVGSGAVDDRALIERSLERTQVLPRLRAAQAGAPNSGS